MKRLILVCMLMTACTKAPPYNCEAELNRVLEDSEWRAAQCRRFEPGLKGPCWDQWEKSLRRDMARLEKEFKEHDCDKH